MSISAQQPYLVLARKYRPTLLKELKGQDTLVRTLTNAIRSNRIAHAFLLTGIRGVGKTTTARIIARSLNCVGTDGAGGPTTEPCGVCQHCTAIREERHPDILEMDAASRTGVGDIREIIENARYLPVMSRYKVYIIDEVHMLSTNAFNALLKTLEEPPPHVIFIFATTEIRKIPVTILSRCQRFDLRRVSAELLQQHLGEIATIEQCKVEPEALALIAQAAEGSVRDSLSLLDRAISHHMGATVTAQDVRGMLGIADRTALFELLEHIAAGRIQDALSLVQALYIAGTEPVQLVEDLMELVHLITTLKVTPTLGDSLPLPENERVRSRKLLEKLGIAYLTRCWQMLLKGLAEARQAPIPLQAVEMVMIRLAYMADLPSPATLIRQVSGSTKDNSPRITPLQGESAVTVQKNIASFREMVELFRQQKELLLYHALQSETRLVRFAPGRVEIHPSKETPADFKKKLEECLSAWTGMAWNVIISADASQPTLQEERENEQARVKSEAAAHPVVRAVLDTFPGATIKEVRERQ